MKTARYIILFALLAVLAVGCFADPEPTREEIEEQIAQRKQDFEGMRLLVEEQMTQMGDLFEVRWSLPVHDSSYTRAIENVQIIGHMICLYGSDGNLLFVNGKKGVARSFYNSGREKVAFPIDFGFGRVRKGDTTIEKLFVYFSTGREIHCLADPLARNGALPVEWVAVSDYAILTPLCNSKNAVFFGCADGKIYLLPKLTAAEFSAMRPVIRVKKNINIGIPPVMLKTANYPFCIDDGGNLYLYGGTLGKEQKPIRTDLAKPTAPMLVDDETKTLLIPTQDFRLYALDAVVGVEKKWVAYPKAAYITGEMKLHKGSVYVRTTRNELFAYSMRGGRPLWGEKTVPEVERVIGPARDGNLYLLLTGPRLAKLDIQTGAILFERPLPDVQFIVCDQNDGTLFLVNALGRIWAISER